MSNPIETVIASPSPRVVRAFGEESHFYLTGEDTAGRFTHWLEVTPPGGGTPLHYHTGEEEWFYVVKGRVNFYRDGAWTELGPGESFYAPLDQVHAFRNDGSEPAHMLITSAPSGFETFLARCAEEFNQPGGPDMGRITEIANGHGIFFVQE